MFLVLIVLSLRGQSLGVCCVSLLFKLCVENSVSFLNFSFLSFSDKGSYQSYVRQTFKTQRCFQVE